MKNILVVNAGSSSIKFQIIQMPQEKVLTSASIEKIGDQDSIFKMKTPELNIKNIFPVNTHEDALNYFLHQLIENKVLKDLSEINVCGHRIAHGGEFFRDSVIIDGDVSEKIEKLCQLAPLHNKVNLRCYQILNVLLKDIVHIAVFDTSFHQDISKEIYTYAIPYKYYEKYNIRKYGFHGTSHKYVSLITSKILGEKNSEKIIVCHLGNGASISAIKNGICINTSMGLSPLGGIIMGTRSGNLDPSIIEFIMNNDNKSIEDVLSILNKESGLLGISSKSNDMRELLNSTDEQSILAINMYCRKVSDYIGAYFMHLGGLDAIVFTAGVGENSAYIREKIISNIKDATNTIIDNELNENGRGDRIISNKESNVKVLVISTNEEVMIAKDSYRLSMD